MCLKKRKHEAAISDLKMELESVKKQSDNTLHSLLLTQRKNRKYEATISNLQMELKSVKMQSDNRLNQIENRLADLEQGTYLEDRSNDDDYYYDSNPPENFDSQNY